MQLLHVPLMLVFVLLLVEYMGGCTRTTTETWVGDCCSLQDTLGGLRCCLLCFAAAVP